MEGIKEKGYHIRDMISQRLMGFYDFCSLFVSESSKKFDFRKFSLILRVFGSIMERILIFFLPYEKGKRK